MGTENVVLTRDFRHDDVERVERLIHTTIDTCYVGAYPLEAVAFFKSHHSCDKILRDADHGYTIVLDHDGELMGVGALVANRIVRVYVDCRHQHQGHGRRIMRELEKQAAHEDVDRIVLDSSKVSKDFYHRLGYTVVCEAVIEVDNGKSLGYFEMTRVLSITSPHN
jgi:predicted N-acetyltransferase YhbS